MSVPEQQTSYCASREVGRLHAWLAGLEPAGCWVSVLPRADPSTEGSLGFMSTQEESECGLLLQTSASSFPRTLLEETGPTRSNELF